MDSYKHDQMIRCVEGTMNLEGIDLTEESRINLSRYVHGEATFDEILHEIYDKFYKPVEGETTYNLEDKK